MQNSDAADSPTMDLISQMIQGQEDILREAATFSIVVWPGHASPQNIEGWGGDRSRNVNAITKATKAAISGSNKGPCVSSHPHHINIIDKLDGTPDFKCMRINFDSRTDRNLFCQARLITPQPGAHSMWPPSPLETPHCYPPSTLPPPTTSCHHPWPPTQATTPGHQPESPPSVTIPGHHPKPPPQATTCYHHPLLPPRTATLYYHPRPLPLTTSYIRIV